jgi:hypothetical protein
MKKHTCSKCGNVDIILESIEDFLIPEHLQDIWPDFMEVRKKLKAANTLGALKLLLKKIQVISKNHEIQRKVIMKSITSSWKDVFPLQVDELKMVEQKIMEKEKSKELTNKEEPMDEETFQLLQNTTRKLSQKWLM